MFNSIILPYIESLPNLTPNQLASYLQNILVTGNGLSVIENFKSKEKFTNPFSKKVYTDFTQRFSMLPTEYTPAL